jgi:2-polyprenyl-3-methyl-5-hydroxy-6-metoxy-1,4-benzoquinol methylase
MDRLIKRFDTKQDADLMICAARGIAYQANMAVGRVPYGTDYFAKVKAYEDTEVARAVNAGRCAFLLLLDIGTGSGAFMREAKGWGFEAKGYDVIPEVVEMLQAAESYSEDIGAADIVTMWDTLEHLEAPEAVLKRVRRGAWLFVSIPVFEDLSKIRKSKHYRPGEHLYYWTHEGLVNWLALYGFRFVALSAHEIEAGREAIGAFAFVRDLPDYHDHIAAYKEMHASKHYGSSATELHLGTVTHVVQELKPMSIFDYGCGRSDLVAHFYRDGKRRLARYDPAIPAFQPMPEGTFDLAFCCDVLEHIPMADLDRVLAEVKAKSGTVLFTISLKLAKARLPDGRNAHVTILTRSEWMRWLQRTFGSAQELKSEWAHELIVLAGSKVWIREAT